MDDWAYCEGALREVSRTFSKPIESLPDPLRRAVTCGYLLCRIADTVEDRPDLALSDRDALFGALLEVLESGAPARDFKVRFEAHPQRSPDDALCRSLDRVMAVFEGVSPEARGASVPFITEMIRGMSLYSHRPAGDDGINAVFDLADLERYCWFVAGTVGRMLTELFVQHLGSDLDPRAAETLRRSAGEFGLGLQLTNVLKDVTDDRARRVSYVPRGLARAEGISLSDLCDPQHRQAAHRALAPLFSRAAAALEEAFAYVLSIPKEAAQIRLFCLMPIWMAQRTLRLAEGNDDIFIANEPVKITREDVGALIADCVARCGDDVALADGWRRLGGTA